MKIIRDNIHGDIEFFPEEMRLLHTAGFERLHGCRQFGLTHLIYPGAKHSRFEHVLGVMHVASQIAARLRSQRYFFQGTGGDRLLRILRFAALLHDMGHVPYGHTFEDEMPIISKHDEPSGSGTSNSRMESAVSEVLQQSGNAHYQADILQVLRAIDASKDDNRVDTCIASGQIGEDHLVLADIIGNTICADLLDYIKRDHMMSGIKATYDDRIFRYFSVGEYRGHKRIVISLVKNGRVRNDALADLLDILKLRYNLSDKVLFHPKKCSADAMLIKAVKDAGLSEPDLMRYSDDGLLDHIAEQPLVQMIRQWTLFKPVFVCGRANIATYDENNSKDDLIKKLHKGTDLRTKIESRVTKELGLPRNQTSVLIYCPSPKMTLKPVRALVRWKDGTIRRLNDLKQEDDAITYDQVSLLERIYPQLWKLYLFVQPTLRSHGHSIRTKFCDVLKEETGLTAACDPAFQHYLEEGCLDYKFGQLIDEELDKTQAFALAPRDTQIRISSRCHHKVPDDKFDDEYAEPDAIAIASRGNEAVLLSQVRTIIDSVVQEVVTENESGQGVLPSI